VKYGRERDTATVSQSPRPEALSAMKQATPEERVIAELYRPLFFFNCSIDTLSTAFTQL
jgi:hypothetical protein